MAKNSKNRLNILGAIVALILLVGLAACVANPTASGSVSHTEQRHAGASDGDRFSATSGYVSITEHQVKSIVENMLSGYNNGDYTAFSRDLSAALKLVASEKQFQAFRSESEATLGKFQSITSIQQRDSDRTSSHWVVDAKFENSAKEISVAFDRATGQIEGLLFGPAH